MAERGDKPISVIGIRGFPFIQGGVEHHSEELYPVMPFDFTVYRRKPYIDTSRPTPEYKNITFIDLPSTRIAGLEAVLHTFLASLSCIVRRPRLVHVHNIGPGLFTPLLKLGGLKVVLTYHSPNYEHAKWSLPAKLILKMAEKIALTFSDRIIFVNKAQMAKFPEKVRRKSVHIYNGVNEVKTVPDTGILAKYGLSDRGYVLAVGRLTPEKGFDHLIRAVNAMEHPPVLVIAGGADHGDACLRELKALDRRGDVVFTGNLTHGPLSELYSHAGAFILSSVNEGFPIVMLEAMGHGLPVLASRIPATDIPQLSDDNRFLPGNPEDLRRVMEARLPELMGKRMEYDLSDYDWLKIGARTADVYRSLKAK